MKNTINAFEEMIANKIQPATRGEGNAVAPRAAKRLLQFHAVIPQARPTPTPMATAVPVMR